MLKILLDIWIKQKRRNFRWLPFIYVLYLYACFFGSFFFSIYASGSSLEELADSPWDSIAPFLVLMPVPIGLIIKILFGNSIAYMDAVFATRPITKQDWFKFILVSNLLEFTNLIYALPLALFSLVVMPIAQGVFTTILLFLVSYVNGMAALAWRTRKAWEWRCALFTGWLFWITLIMPAAYNLFKVAWWVHFAWIGFLAVGGLIAIGYYLVSLRDYLPESRQKAVKTKRPSKLKAKGKNHFLMMELLAWTRSPRLRQQLILGFIITFYGYFGLLSGDMESNTSMGVLIPIGMMMLSSMYLQLTFATEANFFDGLATRPIDIKAYLYRKYYISIGLATVSFMIVAPIIFLSSVKLIYILSLYVLIIGYFNTTMISYALISKRLDLFAKGYMNMQGANFSPAALGFSLIVFTVPIALLLLLDRDIIPYVYFAIGAIGLASHRWYIGFLGRKYIKNKYKHYERYRAA